MSGFFLQASNGETYELGSSVLVGRSEECDLRVVEGHPSRRHAQITVRDDGVHLEDLGSANGTFVNGQRVQGSRKLAPGDKIRFDAAEFTLGTRGAAREDDLRTVIRSQRLEPGTSEVSKALETPAPSGPQRVVAQDTPKTPGAWANPDRKSGPGTRLFSPDELKALAGGGQGGPSGTVVEPSLLISSGASEGTA